MDKSDKANPGPVDEIVDDLIEGMSPRERSVFADLTEEQLLPLQLRPLGWIRSKGKWEFGIFQFWISDCRLWIG